MAYSYAEYVPLLKALSDETRLKIVDMLSSGELCACKILERFSITQPTLSYHMKILTESGIVVGRREGSWMNYSLNKEKGEDLMRFFSNMISSKDDCVCNCCENKKNTSL